MKRKNILLLIVAILSATIITSNVKAKEIEKESDYIINKINVKIKKEDYERLSEFVNVDFLSQKIYDRLKDAKLEYKGTEEKYIETRSLVDKNGNVYQTINNEMNKEDFEKAAKANDNGLLRGSCGTYCWQTSYKTLRATVFTRNGQNVISGELGWTQDPNVRSYDVFAFRGDNFTISYYAASQYYYSTTGNEDPWRGYDYNATTGTNNIKHNSHAVGVSMNLVDDAIAWMATIYIEGNATSGTAYLTYQHAQSNLTLAQSKSYTFSYSGLGHVLYYSNSTIRNKYDNMTPLTINY